MSKRPAVTVIITTYNRAELLQETLRSVAAQSYKDYEVIVVDDGSTDNTAQVISVAGMDVRYIWQSNAGPTIAKNRGMAMAAGEYIAHLDSDDVWMPDHLSECVGALEAHPEVDLVFSDVRRFADDSVWHDSFFARHPRIYALPGLTREGHMGILRDGSWRELLKETYIFMGAVVMKHEIYQKMGGFDERLVHCEDWEYWMRIARTYTLGFVDRPSLLIRDHNGNISGNRGKQISGEIRVLELVRDECQELDEEVLRTIREELRRRNFDAGYQFFDQGDLRNARKRFWASWQMDGASLRTAAYLLASCCPIAAVEMGRKVKQSLRTRR